MNSYRVIQNRLIQCCLDFSLVHRLNRAKMVDFTILLSLYLVLEFIVFTFSVFGNLLIIYVVLTVKKLEKLSTKCIVNVAVIDILVGLVATPLTITRVRN